MRKNRVRKLQLRPRLVTGITAGFMIISTLVSSVAIVNNSINARRMEEAKAREINEQIIEKNMQIGEAEEGVLRESLVGSVDEENTVVNIRNGDDGVKAMGETVDPSNWDLNKVYIYTDPDGVKVPVPIGWTASGAESERYVNHNVTKTGTLSDLTFSSSGDYPWTKNEDNVWVSGNYNVHSTTSELVSDEITVGEDGGYLSIEWSVISQTGYDLLSITITNTDTGTSETPTNISGSNFGTNYNSLVYTKYNRELEEGKYIISLKYTKNASSNSGLDRGYVKGGTILNYASIGENKVTIHEHGGLVIYEGTDEVTDANAWNESKNRNQFVWIPVADTNRIYETSATTGRKNAKLWKFTATTRTAISNGNLDWKREPGVSQNSTRSFIKYYTNQNLQGYAMDLFYKELQSEYDKAIESIEKYGGFYIGRYETGNISSQTPVVRRLNTNTTGQIWYNIYLKMKNISSNEKIQTSMIWGSLWDETLQWIIETGDKTSGEVAADSSSWGNYWNTTFIYTNNDGTTATKTGNRSVLTGSTERNKANNIYDLAGNQLDYTLERKLFLVSIRSRRFFWFVRLGCCFGAKRA